MMEKNKYESNAMKLFAFVADTIDIDNIPLDDQKTYDLLAKADTDGVFWLESKSVKYDLLQIQPKNFEELTACIALGFPQQNPYIYTYLKKQKVQPCSYPPCKDIEAVNDILKDSHGMLLYKEQVVSITDYIANMSDADKMNYEMAIKILTNEIKERKGTVISRAFCRERAMFCYRNAYIKANFPDKFNCFIKNENKED